MKIILVLDNYNETISLSSLYDCKNRYQLYAYLLYKYLNQQNILVIFKNDNMVIHDDDHFIIIGSSRLKDRMNCKTVTRLDISNLHHYQNENTMFYMDNFCRPRDDTKLIGWLCDSDNLYPDTSDKLLRIVMQDRNDEIIDGIIGIREIYDVEIGIMTNNYYEDITTGSVTILDNYESRYDIIRKTDVYVITSNIFDRELLYNFAMCDTVLVLDDRFINAKIDKDFDFVCYDKDDGVLWDQVMDKLVGFKSRDKIMQSGLNCASDAVSKIVDWFENSKEEANNQPSSEYENEMSNISDNDDQISVISEDDQLISETSDKYDDAQLDYNNYNDDNDNNDNDNQIKKIKRRHLIQSSLRLTKH